MRRHNRALLPPQCGRMSRTPEGRHPVRADRYAEQTGDRACIAGFVDFARHDRQMSWRQEERRVAAPGKSRRTECRIRIETIADLGNEPPLIADGRSGPPDRREVSARWLSGTFLTGVTSSVLMGVALFAALDGREQLATPPEIAELVGLASERRFRREGQDDAAGAAAPDRQGQGPPPHGSVDGHQGRRPRRHQHHALRPDQDGAGRRPHDDAQLSALRSARGVRRGRRRRRPLGQLRPARSMASRSRAR